MIESKILEERLSNIAQTYNVAWFSLQFRKTPFIGDLSFRSWSEFLHMNALSMEMPKVVTSFTTPQGVVYHHQFLRKDNFAVSLIVDGKNPLIKNVPRLMGQIFADFKRRLSPTAKLETESGSHGQHQQSQQNRVHHAGAP